MQVPWELKGFLICNASVKPLYISIVIDSHFEDHPKLYGATKSPAGGSASLHIHNLSATEKIIKTGTITAKMAMSMQTGSSAIRRSLTKPTLEVGNMTYHNASITMGNGATLMVLLKKCLSQSPQTMQDGNKELVV
mgnify:CR=1 FL=1